MKSTKHTYSSGNIVYYNKNGYLHREDGPAWIGSDGTKEWWLNSRKYSYEEWLYLTSIAYKWKEFCEVN